MSSRFHLAIPVKCIEESKAFYCNFLGCEEGNCEKDMWQDINFWGNELIAPKINILPHIFFTVSFFTPEKITIKCF